MVSILLITYNHELYIRQAIESVLMQETNFPFELVIGDDCSTDRTREICKEYQSKFPAKISLLLRDKNIGPNPNFIETLRQCKGKYIALLEGDDYWTHPLKLQKQFDFLEANSDCILCHHWHEIAELNGDRKYIVKPAPREGHGYYPEIKSDVSKIFSNELRIKSRTLMFRNVDIDYSGWFSKVLFSDVAHSILLGEFGKFGFINEPMAVYRLTGAGISTEGSHQNLYTYNHYMEYARVWEYGLKHFNYAYFNEGKETILHFYKFIIRHYKYKVSIFLRLTFHALLFSRLSLTKRINVYFELLSFIGSHLRQTKFRLAD